MFWQTTRFRVDLTRPQVMGIVNVTPDSFSDGGRHAGLAKALRHCELLVQDGAHIRHGRRIHAPGAPPVPLDEELARVVPLVREAIPARRASLCGYLQTRGHPGPNRARNMGADIINDILGVASAGRAGCRVGAASVVPACA